HNLCTIRHMLSSDTLVMTERDDYALSSGKPMPHSMVAVYELDEQGLIKAWREYLDTADLARKKGVASTRWVAPACPPCSTEPLRRNPCNRQIRKTALRRSLNRSCGASSNSSLGGGSSPWIVCRDGARPGTWTCAVVASACA